MSKGTKFHHVGDDADDTDGECEVGYGRPPKSRQFKKGQSGNPKGRKPRVAYEEHDLPFRRYMMEPMPAKVNGKIARVTKFDAVFLKVFQKAMEGDFRCMKLLIEQSGGFKEFRAEWKRQKSEADLKMIDEVLKMGDILLSASAHKKTGSAGN